MISVRPYFQIRSHSQMFRIRTSTYLLEEQISAHSSGLQCNPPCNPCMLFHPHLSTFFSTHSSVQPFLTCQCLEIPCSIQSYTFSQQIPSPEYFCVHPFTSWFASSMHWCLLCVSTAKGTFSIITHAIVYYVDLHNTAAQKHLG
jgi:hypothetical protein